MAIVYSFIDDMIKSYHAYKNKLIDEKTSLDLGISHDIHCLIDTKKSPHLLVNGLSQQGKTYCIKRALMNKPCILINVDIRDYQDLNNVILVLNDLEDVLFTLRQCLQNNSDDYIYIVIDDILACPFFANKDFQSLVTQILAKGSHFNLCLICITQLCDKEIVKFKNLFNVRIAFNCVDDSCYRTCLGYTPADTTIMPYHFYCNMFADTLFHTI